MISNRFANNDDNMDIVASVIKEKRISKGYSVKQLSELADLPVSVIEKAEKGCTNIRFEEYIIIFVVLGIIKPDFFS